MIKANKDKLRGLEIFIPRDLSPVQGLVNLLLSNLVCFKISSNSYCGRITHQYSNLALFLKDPSMDPLKYHSNK